jgi:hypothetical protein
MAHKKQRKAPVPKGNRRRGPLDQSLNGPHDERVSTEPTTGTGFQEQDAKRRLGDYAGAGEHPFVQPGGRNDANR